MKLTVDMEELVLSESIEYMMVYDAGKTGKWEIVLMHNKSKDMIGVAQFEQKGGSGRV